MTRTIVIKLKHPNNANVEVGFLLFGNEFDTQLRLYSNALCCFRKFWRYDEILEFLQGKLGRTRTPEFIKAASSIFLSIGDICIRPCWLYVRPNVKQHLRFYQDYARLKKLVLKMKNDNGELPLSESCQLTSEGMVGFGFISSYTILKSVAWYADNR
jgi:hypothetical protein